MNDLLSCLVVDTESTGIDPDTDELIWLAVCKVDLNHELQVTAISAPLVLYDQPSRMTPEVAQIVGLGLGELKGARLDRAAVSRIMQGSSWVIAHNADFDRALVGRYVPSLAALPWLCSMTEIDWAGEEEQPAASLRHLFDLYGIAEGVAPGDDCAAIARLLARPLPVSPRTGFQELLQGLLDN